MHTLCIPVTDQLSEIFTSVDQLAVVSLLAKMGMSVFISEISYLKLHILSFSSFVCNICEISVVATEIF